MHSLYDILMIKKEATQKELRERYFKLTRMYNPNSKSGSYKHYLDVVNAYNILKDKYKRDFYNNCGELGLESFTDPRKEYFMTRVFDNVNVKLLMVIVTMIIMNITTMPMALYLHQHFDLKFTEILFPMMVALTMANVFVIRAIIHLKKYRVERLIEEITYMMIIGINLLLLLFQIISICFVLDKGVKSYKFIWMMPFILIELVLFIKLTINNPGSVTEHIKSNVSRIIRIALMSMFLFEVNMKYKIFIPLAIIISKMIFRQLPYKTIIYSCGYLLLVLCGVYICIDPPFQWCAYVLGLGYFLLGVILVLAILVTKKKYSPLCNFGDQLSLEYEV